MKKKLLSLFVVLCLAVTSVSGMAFAGSKVTHREARAKTQEYMISVMTDLSDLGIDHGDWMVMGLARNGVSLHHQLFDRYYTNAVKKLKAQKGELHHIKYTDYSRTILALTAMGRDPSDIGGYNLLDRLADLNKVKKQGINGPIWALIALDSGNYSIPVIKGTAVQTTRDHLIRTILDAQLSDGGFALSGEKADPDMTGMALQALAKYYRNKNYPKVTEAVDRALECVSSIQKSDGGFASWGTRNAESISQIIVALTALGIDPEKDERFIRNGNSAIDALLAYYVRGGGFKHTADGKVNSIATEQAFYALTAYQRLLDGKKSLYDMTDTVKPQKKPAKPVLLSAKSVKAKSVVVKWKKVSGADGYQIRHAANKKFKDSKAVNVSAKTSVKTLKNLKRSKARFIKVRAYRTGENGSRIYGSYSKVKKVIVK